MVKIIESFDRSGAQKIEAPDASAIKEYLDREILGQSQATERWASIVNRVAGDTLRLRKGPLTVVTEVGPSGTGKTEIVRQVAEYLASLNEKKHKKTRLPAPVLRIDCGEYQEKHEIAKVLGSPPGYVGGEHTPRLAQSEIDKYSIEISPNKRVTIVLFDEIEKAHPNFSNAILGALDYGALTLGNNQKTDLTNCIVVFTSNLGNKEIAQRQEESTKEQIGFINTKEKGEGSSSDAGKNDVRLQEMRKHFTPEQLSRMGGEANTIVFNELSHDMVEGILTTKLSHIEKKYAEHGVSIEFQPTKAGSEALLKQGYSSQEGVRRLEHVLDREILAKLTRLPRGSSRIAVAIDADGEKVELWMPQGIVLEKKASVVFLPPNASAEIDKKEEEILRKEAFKVFDGYIDFLKRVAQDTAYVESTRKGLSQKDYESLNKALTAAVIREKMLWGNWNYFLAGTRAYLTPHFTKLEATSECVKHLGEMYKLLSEKFKDNESLKEVLNKLADKANGGLKSDNLTETNPIVMLFDETFINRK